MLRTALPSARVVSLVSTNGGRNTHGKKRVPAWLVSISIRDIANMEDEIDGVHQGSFSQPKHVSIRDIGVAHVAIDRNGEFADICQN